MDEEVAEAVEVEITVVAVEITVVEAVVAVDGPGAVERNDLRVSVVGAEEDTTINGHDSRQISTPTI